MFRPLLQVIIRVKYVPVHTTPYIIAAVCLKMTLYCDVSSTDRFPSYRQVTSACQWQRAVVLTGSLKDLRFSRR
jgi:hypothetical protein